MTLRRGDPWGSPVTRDPDLTLTGTDADLARALGAAGDQPLIRWSPRVDSDLGRGIGLDTSGPTAGTAVPMDALRSDTGLAVNAVTWGTPPDRLRWASAAVPVTVTVDGRRIWEGPALCVVIANGEFIAGAPVLPKAHPGDGVLDVLVIGLRRTERRVFRRRLPHGEHLPHPRLVTARGRSVTLTGARSAPVTVDGEAGSPQAHLAIRLESDRYQLIV